MKNKTFETRLWYTAPARMKQRKDGRVNMKTKRGGVFRNPDSLMQSYIMNEDVTSNFKFNISFKMKFLKLM